MKAIDIVFQTAEKRYYALRDEDEISRMTCTDILMTLLSTADIEHELLHHNAKAIDPVTKQEIPIGVISNSFDKIFNRLELECTCICSK